MQTETAGRLAHPDLLPLLEQGKEGVERYACIVLAMLDGAVWVRKGEQRTDLPMARWVLESTACVGLLHMWDATGEIDDLLPNPLADTEAGRAAAWDLMVREQVRPMHCRRRGGDYWLVSWGDSFLAPSVEHPHPQHAAVLAVLHKYKDGNLSHLILPLLDKMTEEPV